MKKEMGYISPQLEIVKVSLGPELCQASNKYYTNEEIPSDFTEFDKW